MKGNEGENTTRGNRKVSGRETGRFRRGNKQSEGGGAFVTVSFQSSVTVSPPLEKGNSSRMMSENENTEKRKKTGSKGRGNKK